jgi:hypothetical protein
VRHWYLLIPLFLLGSCVGPPAPLVVKQFKMLDVEIDNSADPMVRGEKQRRLFGAVSGAEQFGRLGAYYTILWRDPKGAGSGEVEVLFEYQQGATASKVKRLSKRFGSAEASGKVEFAIIGNDYAKQGRVLAWKTTLTRGGRVVATEKSHLWQ